MHPLTPDLSGLKDDELQRKCAELSNKLNMAYRFGQAELVGQIQMILEDYNNEMMRRQQKMLEEVMSRDNKFKDIIDIK